MSRILVIVIVSVMQFGCVGPIYYVESSTVLENEAAGEWPDIEKQMKSRLQKEGVTFYEKEDENQRRKRALNTINGELVTNE